VFLRVGSTGGAGANVFTQEGGIPLSAQVLYFDPASGRLLAFDLIQQSPETGSLQVERHLASEISTEAPPSPLPTSPGSPTATDSPPATP
jgi:hypothetical protein